MGFQVFEEPFTEPAAHPENYKDYECAFAADCIRNLHPKRILDIGSYRLFIVGLLSEFQVTTVDVRKRRPASRNETVVTCDAKSLDLPNDTFDLVLSLCSLEHFGLGRYGDEFDPEADGKAFEEMIRVLKVGGHLVFSTTITNAKPNIAFNAHRIYSYEMIHQFCDGLTNIDEKFYSHKIGGWCKLDEITREAMVWDVYCGCWRK